MIAVCFCTNCEDKFERLERDELITYRAIIDTYVDLGCLPIISMKEFPKIFKRTLKNLEMKGFLTTLEMGKDDISIRLNGMNIYEEIDDESISKLYGICFSDEHREVYNLDLIV